MAFDKYAWTIHWLNKKVVLFVHKLIRVLGQFASNSTSHHLVFSDQCILCTDSPIGVFCPPLYYVLHQSLLWRLLDSDRWIIWDMILGRYYTYVIYGDIDLTLRVFICSMHDVYNNIKQSYENPGKPFINVLTLIAVFALNDIRIYFVSE